MLLFVINCATNIHTFKCFMNETIFNNNVILNGDTKYYSCVIVIFQLV